MFQYNKQKQFCCPKLPFLIYTPLAAFCYAGLPLDFFHPESHFCLPFVALPNFFHPGELFHLSFLGPVGQGLLGITFKHPFFRSERAIFIRTEMVGNFVPDGFHHLTLSRPQGLVLLADGPPENINLVRLDSPFFPAGLFVTLVVTKKGIAPPEPRFSDDSQRRPVIHHKNQPTQVLGQFFGHHLNGLGHPLVELSPRDFHRVIYKTIKLSTTFQKTQIRPGRPDLCLISYNLSECRESKPSGKHSDKALQKPNISITLYLKAKLL